MDDEKLPNFSIDFDFLNDEYLCEDVPDDILLSLEETLCDKIAAVDKENRYSMAIPEGCNATSRSNNKTPKKLKADTSKKRFVEGSSTDIDEIIENAESRKTKYQTKWAVSTFNGMYKAQFTEFQLELQHIICNTYTNYIKILTRYKM